MERYGHNIKLLEIISFTLKQSLEEDLYYYKGEFNYNDYVKDNSEQKVKPLKFISEVIAKRKYKSNDYLT